MIVMKYSPPQLQEMTLADVLKFTGELLLKIHVITGWEVPQQELLLILRDQLYRKLIEDFPQLNTQEIEYAFRNAGCSIEDWGKTMNLNLIDKILVPYVGKRYDLGKLEEIKAPPPKQKIYTEDELLNIQRCDIEMFYQRLRNGRTSPVPDYFAEVLLRDGLLLAVEYEDQDSLIDSPFGETPTIVKKTRPETVGEFFVRKLNTQAQRIYIKSK